MKRINLLKAKRAEREGRELNEAEELGRKINKLKITMELETGEQGKAFGSITAADIAERLKSAARRQHARSIVTGFTSRSRSRRPARRDRDQAALGCDGEAHAHREGQGRRRCEAGGAEQTEEKKEGFKAKPEGEALEVSR